ncbi:MAG: hypothetical protein VYB40_00795, partial [Candidatus Thermoplasmatota archaeon]|nr:hypothetical protein [Candidatus Thermoplasmatota archaeon]
MVNRWIFSENYRGKLSLALVLLMLVHILSPIVPSQELSEQENNQMDVAKNLPTTDVVLEPLQWISGSYIDTGGGGVTLSEGVQQILVTFRNDGLHTAIIDIIISEGVSIALTNRIGCDAVTYEVVGNSQQQCVIQWDAVSSQTGFIQVQIVMTGLSPSIDSDATNNVQNSDMFVVNSEADVIIDAPDIDARMPLGVWDLEIGSINLGNI